MAWLWSVMVGRRLVDYIPILLALVTLPTLLMAVIHVLPWLHGDSEPPSLGCALAGLTVYGLITRPSLPLPSIAPHQESEDERRTMHGMA